MSDTNRVQKSYIKEVTWGVTPATPTMQIIRMAGETLGVDTQTVRSQEIDPNRDSHGSLRVGKNLAGGLNLELSYGTHDDFLSALLQSTAWSTVVTFAVVNVTFTAGSSQYTVIRAAGSWITDGYAVSQWVKITGAADAANNGYAKIVSRTASNMVVNMNGNGVTQAGAATVTVVMGAQIVNGITAQSFSFETLYNDLVSSEKYVKQTGWQPNTGVLTISDKQIITLTMEGTGNDETSLGATPLANAYTPITTTSVVTANNDVFGVLENGAAFDVTQFVFNFNNNTRVRTHVGSVLPLSIGNGQFLINMTVNGYYSSKAIIDKYLAFTSTSFATIIKDAAGNAYLIDVPECKLTAGKRHAPGPNGDVMMNLTVDAGKHATEAITLRIVRFAGP